MGLMTSVCEIVGRGGGMAFAEYLAPLLSTYSREVEIVHVLSVTQVAGFKAVVLDC